MNTVLEKMKLICSSSESTDLQTILKSVYFFHEKRKDFTGNIHRYSSELDSKLDGLDFSVADPVRCCVNALCAEYDYAAFTEGFQAGASLILAFLESTIPPIASQLTAPNTKIYHSKQNTPVPNNLRRRVRFQAILSGAFY